MLETIDLSRSLDKASYKECFPALKASLALLQRRAFESGMTTIVVFEGLDAAGKGDTIGQLVNELDPRGFRVHVTSPPTEEERLHPFLWRHWLRLPAAGGIGVFDRSWYQRVLGERVSGDLKPREWQQAYQEINQFEQQLAEDGHVIIKLFLHISKKEQRARFKQMARSDVEAWRVDEEGLDQNRRYDEYIEVAEEMLERTGTSHAPWTVIEATDRRYRRVKTFQTVIQALDEGLERKELREETRGKLLDEQRAEAEKRRKQKPKAEPEVDGEAPAEAEVVAVEPEGPLDNLPTVLDRVDLESRLEPGEYKKRRKKLQERLRELEFECFMQRMPVVIAYEGWDAAGKGGNIRRVTEVLDPRGYYVVPIGAPKGDDATHHYLWRFWRNLPKAGHIAIYDRTWYGRVLVERVENLITRDEWRRGFTEINEFEQMLVNYGMVVVKFWLHISQEEQLARFEGRQVNEAKRYKITDEDWRNREKWDEYRGAVVEMLERTSTSYAPWTILAGEDKQSARIQGLETIVEAIEKGLDARKNGG